MNKESKLIVLDLDGTLLTKDKKIPFLTRHYIKSLSMKGHQVVLASGRPLRSMINYYNQLGLTTPAVSYNGGHVAYPNYPDRDIRYYIKDEDVLDVLDKVGKIEKIYNVIFETDKHIYITNKEVNLDKSFWLQGMEVHYGTIEDNLKYPRMTFIIELENKNYDPNKLLAIFKDNKNLNIRFWRAAYQGYLEIYQRDVNKGTGLNIVAKELGFSKENIICFCDDNNDHDLFDNCGVKFAMKNGLDDIKEKADYITDFDNNHEGVRKALKKYLAN